MKLVIAAAICTMFLSQAMACDGSCSLLDDPTASQIKAGSKPLPKSDELACETGGCSLIPPAASDPTASDAKKPGEHPAVPSSMQACSSSDGCSGKNDEPKGQTEACGSSDCSSGKYDEPKGQMQACASEGNCKSDEPKGQMQACGSDGCGNKNDEPKGQMQACASDSGCKDENPKSQTAQTYSPAYGIMSTDTDITKKK